MSDTFVFDFDGEFPLIPYFEDNPEAKGILDEHDEEGLSEIADDIATGIGAWAVNRGLNLLALRCDKAREEAYFGFFVNVSVLFAYIIDMIDIDEVDEDIRKNITEAIEGWEAYLPEYVKRWLSDEQTVE